MTIDQTRDELFAEYFEDREGSAKVAEHAYRQGWKDRATYTVIPSTTPSPISDQAAGEQRFFIDHDVIHDRLTGKHVTLSDDGDPEKGLAICCDLMNSLTAPTTGSAPEPVAWRAPNCSGSGDDWAYRDADDRFEDVRGNLVGEPLYAAPASPAASVLTDEQISAIVDEFDACHWVDGECRIEGRDMMKLCRALLAASMGGDQK